MTASPQGNHYLLEIGAEELPLEFLLSAPQELIDKVKAALNEQALTYGDARVYVTPRRIAFVIQDLPELQEERTFKTKGPPIRVALDASGNPSQAGLGFARKLGVEFSQLAQETIEGDTYMVLNQQMPGRPTQALLAELLPGIVLSLSGSHFMAWGRNTIRFSRPIRWLASVWNNQHLPLQIGPVESGVVSHGHRVMANGPVVITAVADYLELLETEGAVLADQDRRKTLIWQQLQASAQELGGQVAENESLLNTVTMLVEQPSIVVGRFEERFLEIPEEVTTTVMTAHQKYFPVRQPNGQLMPYFMTVSNGRREAADMIRHGNEKVLTARLEDARFFFAEDQKTPLQDRLESLKGITFQKGLGSMYEKTRRLEKLAGQVAEALQYTESDLQQTRRAALLAKADLVTGMVFEFTELQGAMGRKYAKLSGEPEAVAEAIFEHYLPRFTGDLIAQSKVGIAVSLADKMDTVVAVFSQKNAKLPSGSKDPLGLRRMASGIIQTVLENQLTVDLLALMSEAYQTLTASAPPTAQFQDEKTTLDLVNTFILQRFRGWLLEQDNRYDLIDAVLESDQAPLSDLPDVLLRLEALKQLTQQEETLKKVYEPANRIYKILSKQYNPAATTAEVNPTHFRDAAETALLDQIKALEAQPAGQSYMALSEALSAINPAIELFFEKVMVNDPDDAVRKNRYNLLSVLNRFYLKLACFTKLVV
ncbi:glycine--tRNA ligase subunit beta [Vampirovibrio sp.]|uniref:glycine--tRNA ligase subunit beta n=1 Tax=Vampirovibrio sp. TaxID=2717857 RepID=UPI00359380DB